MPPLSSTTGPSPGRSVNVPLGAGDFQTVADANLIAQESAPETVSLLFDTHAVGICAWCTGHRVIAQNWRPIRLGPKFQNEKLARKRSG